MPLEEACKIIVDCPHSTPSYTTEDTGFMCIRTSIVKKNKILWDDIEYIPEDEFIKRIQRKKPEVGDVVYTREGAILGIAAIIDREYNVALGQRLMLLSPDAKDEDNMARLTKSYEERILALEEKEQKSMEATRKLVAQRKELEKRKKVEESKKRTHRLCQIGGAVESVLGYPVEE